MLKRWTPIAGVVGFGIAAYGSATPPAAQACLDPVATVADCYNNEGYCGPADSTALDRDGSHYQESLTFWASCGEICRDGHYNRTVGNDACDFGY